MGILYSEPMIVRDKVGCPCPIHDDGKLVCYCMCICRFERQDREK